MQIGRSITFINGHHLGFFKLKARIGANLDKNIMIDDGLLSFNIHPLYKWPNLSIFM